MQTILLAGGFGTRISEETAARPKPMVEIGGKPLLWHIMSTYSACGYDDFVIACGYRADVIKSYFHNLSVYANDWIIDFRRGTQSPVNAVHSQWRVAIIDTGLNTKTGGRILRLRDWTGGKTFMVTYGDGVADIDIAELVAFHRRHGRLATVTAVRPPARFGALHFKGDQVIAFDEKPQAAEGWINGGFFVFEPGVLDYLEDDETVLEQGPLEKLAAHGQLMAYRHEGFWQPMDTLREKLLLEALWENGKAPWRSDDSAQPRNMRLGA
jgi:glucose-1-phosphate cytidylyltransferase